MGLTAGVESGASEARVERALLTGRLREALASGSVALTAPAGFGKTIALETAIPPGQATATVYCTSEHSDPGRLLGALIDALVDPVPGIAETFDRRIRRSVEPVDPTAALRDVLRDLRRLLVDPLLVVLEDAENIAGSPHALRLVNEMLRDPTGAVRVALLSRRPLPLRIAKVRAHGALTEISAADLAFSASECRELLRLRSGRQPDLEQVAAVMTATEGWPLGIALSDGDAAAVPRSAPSSRDALFSYLAEELLEGFDPDLRRRLPVAAMPTEIDAGLAAALDLPGGFLDVVRARLGEMFRPLPPDGRWHRFHPLLRSFLADRLGDLDGELLRDLRRRLAAGLEEAGRDEEAVEHWLAAEDGPGAARAIARAGPGLLGTSPHTLTEWLERLPPEDREQPSILLLAGQIAYGQGDHPAAADLQRRARRAFADQDDTGMEWACRIALMNTLHAAGEFEEAVHLVADLDSPAVRDVAAAPNLAVMAAMCLSHMGRFEEAERLNEAAVAHPAATATKPLALALEGLHLDRPAGRLDDAVRKAREALAMMERDDPFQRGPFVRALLHLVLEEQGKDEEALAESLRAQEEARRIGVQGYLTSMLQLHSVGIHARAGRLEQAQRELDRASAYEQGAGWRQVSVGQATLAAARGELDRAIELAERTVAEVEHGPFLQRIHAIAFLAPVLVACGQQARARAAVEDTLADWRPGFFRGRLLALRAWLRHLAGEAGWAEDLAIAWKETGSQTPHLLRREWERLEPLLWEALEEGVLVAEEVVAAIERAFPEGAELTPFGDHPSPAVRRAALGPAARSGHPEALRRLTAAVDDPDPSVAQAARGATAALRNEPLRLSFRVFGGFTVTRGSWTLDAGAWQRPMASRLTRFLLTRADEAVPEDEIFEALWAGREAGSARRSLQVTVSQARAALDTPDKRRTAIEASDRSYRLVLAPHDEVDFLAFEQLTAMALTETGDTRRAMLERAAATWGGDPLPEDRYEPWVSVWRERLRDAYSQVLSELVAVCRDSGDAPAEIQHARHLVALDPLNEASQRILIAAYARAGRRADALRQFMECRRALVDELGLEPSADTTGLHARVLASEKV